MKILPFASFVVSTAALILPVIGAGITFGPVKGKAGESIRLVTHSETPGGTIQRSYSGQSSSGSINITRVRNEIEELTVYLKRDWYPTREVKLVDSWEFDPAWVKLISDADL